MMGQANKPAWLVALITLLYFILGLVGINHHEIWLDEAHHFLLAKESVSLADLASNAKYEGHPLLWNVLLFVITRFTHDIFYIQLLNVTIMSVSCFLFLQYSRASIWFCVVVLCSYYFLYEFLVISRNYSLLILALTAVFISIQNNKTKGLYLSLFLLSFTHVFGIIIALVLCIILLFNRHVIKTHRLVLFVLIIHNLIVFYNIQVPKDHFLYHYDVDSIFSSKRLLKGAGMFVKGLFPLPEFSSPVKWNSNLLISATGLAGGALGVFSYAFILFTLRKQKFYLYFYLLCTLAIAACMMFSPVAMGVRYCGFFFILFIYILSFTAVGIQKPAVKTFIMILCLVQVLAGIIFFVSDLKYNFSNAKEVAAFVKNGHLENKTIMASNFSSAPAIAAYLGQKIYYPEHQQPGSYCKWNTWPFLLNNDQLASEIKTHMHARDTLVLILNQHYYRTLLHDTLVFNDERMSFQLAKRFDGAMVNNENYLLFYITRK